MAAVIMVAGLVAFAAEKAIPKAKIIKGDVVTIDSKAGTITVKVDNKNHTYKAESKLLEGINVGDKVELEVAKGKVKSIKKIEAPAPAQTPKE